jgi:hypothetical protein
MSEKRYEYKLVWSATGDHLVAQKQINNLAVEGFRVVFCGSVEGGTMMGSYCWTLERELSPVTPIKESP